MHNKLLKDKKGFTIIEVVIVLAIAALIIVIVLLAVQALQRSQRTKAAQEAASRLLSQEQNWASDRGGATNLTVGTALGGTYVANANINPSIAVNPSAAAATANVMNYAPGTPGNPCNAATGAITGGPSSTTFAVSYWSETAGRAVCIHN